MMGLRHQCGEFLVPSRSFLCFLNNFDFFWINIFFKVFKPNNFNFVNCKVLKLKVKKTYFFILFRNFHSIKVWHVGMFRLLKGFNILTLTGRERNTLTLSSREINSLPLLSREINSLTLSCRERNSLNLSC